MSHTRAPEPAPFPVGTKLVYLGHPDHPDSKFGHRVDGVTHWMEPGVVVEVVEVAYGHQGTGICLDAELGLYDETEDWQSVIAWPCCGHRTLIHTDNAKEFKEVTA